LAVVVVLPTPPFPEVTVTTVADILLFTPSYLAFAFQVSVTTRPS